MKYAYTYMVRILYIAILGATFHLSSSICSAATPSIQDGSVSVTQTKEISSDTPELSPQEKIGAYTKKINTLRIEKQKKFYQWYKKGNTRVEFIPKIASAGKFDLILTIVSILIGWWLALRYVINRS